MFGHDMGIDLGTASVLVYLRGRGIVLQEPSVVAIDTRTKAVMEVGTAARQMLGRTHGGIIALRPLKEGAISDYDITERMLSYFIKKVMGKSIFQIKPRVAICVPSGVTEVERRAVEDAAKQAGARTVHLIEEPIAAAIGAGIDISQARGSMVLDIGGGTTDIAVISLGGCVVSASVKVAGDNLDEAIARYIRKRWNLLIGERTAENIKITVGTASPSSTFDTMEVRGRSLATGLPANVSVTSDDIYDAISEPLEEIMRAVHGVLEETPPELMADISDRGIVMTGGSSLLHGLDTMIADRMRVNAFIADDPVGCVAFGTGKYVEQLTGT
ncbi:MAG: rod shape-determining protein MreB [Clostridiales bacterium]|jgi:rod shape-determining protein MreB|nr:rod shape-determining protein MreB [Clostridiales bacterium]